MIDKFLNGINTLAPFLAAYPIWIKGMFAIWVIFSAVLLVALILGKPSSLKEEDSQGRPDGQNSEKPPKW